VVALVLLVHTGCKEDQNIGATGNFTNTGLRGPAGPTGEAGFPGEKGEKGEKGDAGAAGAVQILGDSVKLDVAIDEVFENQTGKLLWISGGIRLTCNNNFASADLEIMKAGSAEWELQNHVFKGTAFGTIQFPVSFFLMPNAKFRYRPAGDNNNGHCSGEAAFPKTHEWKYSEMN